MSSTSWAEQIIDIEDGYFSEGYPVSAAQAFLVRNNLAHLIDSCTQTRIQWIAFQNSQGIYGVHMINSALATGWMTYSHEFPLTWLASDKPANLFTSATLYAESNETAEEGQNTDYDYILRVVPANTPVASGINPVIEISGSRTTEQSITLGQFNDLSDASSRAILQSAIVPVGISNDGDIFREQLACMLRLEIAMKYPNSDGGYFMQTPEEFVLNTYSILYCTVQEYA